MENEFVFDENDGPRPSAQLQVDTLRRASTFVPSAKAGELTPSPARMVSMMAADAYTISVLVEWLGGADSVAAMAKEKRNWVMRDVARKLGASLSWSTLDK